MDVLIIGAVLIMSCVIIGVTLSEMQRLNKECDELRKELEFVYCMRYGERKYLEEKYPTMGEGARRLKAQQVIMPQVMTEVEKRITESFDARHLETTYAVDIRVRSQ